MLIPSLLQNAECVASAARRRTPTSPQHRSGVPSRLEALEGRCLFSTLTVANTLDSGTGSLRAEIAAAQSGDTIVFAPTLFTSSTLSGSSTSSSSVTKSASPKQGHGKPSPSPTPTPTPTPPPTPMITLTGGELLLTRNLTIQGPGAGLLVISGNNVSRAFEVARGITVTLSGLTMNGSSSSWSSYPLVTNWAGYGGGILNHGTLALSACSVSGTVSGLGQGGGIFNDGTLTVNSCNIVSCRADGSAGSEEAGTAQAACGAGIANWGTATLTNTVISNNTASASTSYPWYNKGGGILNEGTLTLTGCTVSNNYSIQAGGGIFNDGTLTLSGSAVFGNFADDGGGIYNAGTVTVKNASGITGNFISGYDAGDVDNLGVLNLDGSSTIGALAGKAAILI